MKLALRALERVWETFEFVVLVSTKGFVKVLLKGRGRRYVYSLGIDTVRLDCAAMDGRVVSRASVNVRAIIASVRRSCFVKDVVSNFDLPYDRHASCCASQRSASHGIPLPGKPVL